MRISTKGRYSLIALLYLAILDKGVYASAKEIGEKTGISEGYLEQLFIPLRKANIIQGVRGSQGGYYLGRGAGSISAGEVLRIVEGSLSPAECVDASIKNSLCPKKNSCRSRDAWELINRAINETLDSLTILDIVKEYNFDNTPEYQI